MVTLRFREHDTSVAVFLVCFVVLVVPAQQAAAWSPGTRWGSGYSLSVTASAGYLWSSPGEGQFTGAAGFSAGAWEAIRDVAFYGGGALVFDPILGQVSLHGEVGFSLVVAEVIAGLGWTTGILWGAIAEPEAGGLGWAITLVIPLPSEASRTHTAALAPATDYARAMPFLRYRGALSTSSLMTGVIEVGVGVTWGEVGPRLVYRDDDFDLTTPATRGGSS